MDLEISPISARVTKFYPRMANTDGGDHWRVAYEDGDSEDFCHDEMNQHHALFLKKKKKREPNFTDKQQYIYSDMAIFVLVFA